MSEAASDLPPPIGPLTTAHDLCGYPSGLEGLGACAPAQSRYSFHDGLNFRYRGGIRRAPEAGPDKSTGQAGGSVYLLGG